MDPGTGRIQYVENETTAKALGLVPIKRDLTLKEKADMQIRLYSPCGCGSGKKFKFCCKTQGSPTTDAGEPTNG